MALKSKLDRERERMRLEKHCKWRLASLAGLWAYR